MNETSEYRQFTKPAELHKAINTLRGMVAGLSADAVIAADEIQELVHWCTLHEHLRDRHPFSEILPAIERVCADGRITEDESKDILWLCGNFIVSASYYDDITSYIQFLHGMIHGIMADGKLGDEEIHSLHTWIDSHEFLAGTYPFDEINSLLTSVLEDRIIDAGEREMLMAFFSSLLDFRDSHQLSEKTFADLRAKYSVSGICAVCPNIQIEDHTFCFTGASYRTTREEITKTIQSMGGIVRSSVSQRTDYLIVGNAGNPCWVYACYGRKIEEAVSLRKAGAPILIVNETDFWDAVDDAAAGIHARPGEE